MKVIVKNRGGEGSMKVIVNVGGIHEGHSQRQRGHEGHCQVRGAHEGHSLKDSVGHEGHSQRQRGI